MSAPSTRQPSAIASGLAMPSRARTYGVVVGVGVALLIVGLLVPFVIADPNGNADLASGGDALGSDLSGLEPTIDLDGDGTEPTDAAAATNGPTITTVPGSGAAAPGAGEAGDATGPDTEQAADEPRTASDIGITADEIKLGILVPTADFGGVDASDTIGDVQALWQAHLDHVNANGGVNGRTVVPVFREFDGLSFDDMRAACVFLTENAKVFAVVNAGGFYGDPILCVTEQHETPYIGQAAGIADAYERSAGRYFSTSMGKERTLLNFVARMEADGQLAGRKIGILDRDGIDKLPVSSALIPALGQLGYTVTHRATIADDFSVAQSQIPLEVQEMQRKGVDLVLPATGFTHGVLFVQNADAQNYRPKYALSDFAGGATDIYGLGMSDSFDQSIGYTSLRTGEGRVGLPEAEYDARCREQAEAGVGHGIARDSGEYNTAVVACGVLDQFVRGARNAGVNPTRQSLVQALSGLGEFQAPYSGAASYFPGKTDAPDVIRRVQWSIGCRCWTPQTDFTSTQF